jgi:hypothetical protein
MFGEQRGGWNDRGARRRHYDAQVSMSANTS